MQLFNDLFAGKTFEEIAGTGLAALEVVFACFLMQLAETPTEIALCGVAAVLGLTAFALYLED